MHNVRPKIISPETISAILLLLTRDKCFLNCRDTKFHERYIHFALSFFRDNDPYLLSKDTRSVKSLLDRHISKGGLAKGGREGVMRRINARLNRQGLISYFNPLCAGTGLCARPPRKKVGIFLKRDTPRVIMG